MLFHLKEPDYKTSFENQFPTRFYARDPQHILDCLQYYRRRTEKQGALDNPNLAWWLRKTFSREDMEEVERGYFQFFSGMIHVDEANKDKNLFEEVPVTDDFTLHVPEENVGTFSLWRTQMREFKRAQLYKLQNPIDMFMNIAFVPEDIAFAIRDYDLKKFSKAVKADIARRAELSRSPHIRVDGLQKALRGEPVESVLSPRPGKS